ncbi:myb/SANT-like DNA-binding domain-containing protein 3 [Rhipicephalus microplus]|uniref:myb/SANT-like DNA-binding domain-containing protein 3 n=1 Tax=Rhipicephalus microplus TaxID=6941 RepID=UPI003F6B10E0
MSFNDDGGVARDGRKTTATRFVFTREERELLVNLVTRHKAVIENKRTDALTKRAKDSAWEKLTSEYNSQPGIRRVTVAQLRKLWDNEKSKWKKKQSEQKRNLYATDTTNFMPWPAVGVTKSYGFADIGSTGTASHTAQLHATIKVLATWLLGLCD